VRPTPDPALAALLAGIRAAYPSFRLVPKEGSPLMWATYYGLLMFLWCPRFMTHFTTVIVTRVYMPERLIGGPSAYATLRHERVHMRDCLRSGVLPFVASYLFLLPSLLTLRAVWEMRAYAETMRVERERTGAVADATVDHVVRQLVGPSYLWMFPFPRAARRWVERTRSRVLAEPPWPAQTRLP
jgi:hypothetical protein